MASYYDSNSKAYLPIPEAKFYVLSNDNFMSGWGHAQDKINTCVVPCDSLEQAESVARYVHTRDEQRHIRIATKVQSKPNVIYSICDSWKNRAAEKESQK